MPRFRALTFLALLIALTCSPAAWSASATMVVSQVFAGGGNAGAPYTNDFVELFNRGSTVADLGGWSLQYASASGSSWQPTALAGSVQPGGHYLVQLASGTVGAALPTPDAAGASNLAVSGGKVALAHVASALTCGVSCSTAPLVADLVGYGSATDYEGAGPAPAIGNTTAALRAGGRLHRHRCELERLRRRGAHSPQLGGAGHAVRGFAASAERRSCPGRAGERRRRLAPLDRVGAGEHQLWPRGRR